MPEPGDLRFRGGHLKEVPLVELSATPDGVYVESDSMLSVDEAQALIEQMKLAIAQVPKIEWQEEAGPFGVTIVRIVEK